MSGPQKSNAQPSVQHGGGVALPSWDVPSFNPSLGSGDGDTFPGIFGSSEARDGRIGRRGKSRSSGTVGAMTQDVVHHRDGNGPAGPGTPSPSTGPRSPHEEPLSILRGGSLTALRHSSDVTALLG